MAQTIKLDLTAPKVNVDINFRGAHFPIFWQFQQNPSGGLQVIDITGYSARLLAYSDCDMATTPIWTKTTGNGELTIVTAPTKTFIVDGVPLEFTNVFGYRISVTDTEADALFDLEDGLHYLLFANAPASTEEVKARGMFKAKGVC